MSSVRSTSRTVTFLFPFKMPGMQEPHAAGTFDILAEEEQLDVMWDARRTTLSILLRYPGRIEALPVTAGDLEEAILNDRNSGVKSTLS
ncbi:hypothetical protein [Devosia ginsengisoli]|uniref:Uncharacterized protein n=1 Tax=Devosia ginsengisoli TaxID=400770 RepID=A0A5B8LU75_9HYPH|nr:hypothetical protein [Devosia ginsengisoli]QDZ11576.1 hypothetical protein FPZ08_12885 [Devosia ginsengisoli]